LESLKDIRDKAIFSVLLYSWCRVSALINLSVADRITFFIQLAACSTFSVSRKGFGKTSEHIPRSAGFSLRLRRGKGVSPAVQNLPDARAIGKTVLDDQNVNRRFLLSSPGTLHDEEGR
jgi:hypothetical protein